MKVKNKEKLHDQNSKELWTQRKHKRISQLKILKIKIRCKEELHDTKKHNDANELGEKELISH
jgi:hypothetical protein